jgi:isopentenyl-diphosphate Delta-isomerase
MNMEEKVILVDSQDNEIGLMPKLEAHKSAKLHRAFSIFIFNQKNEMLLQQRAKNKYHSALLWTNTCCSHPKPGEKTIDAAHRRLKEEMGFDCKLTEKFHFIYKTKLDNELFENELDHVFVGYYDNEIHLNSDEANDVKWISMEELKKEIELNPEDFTVWLKIIIAEHFNKLML